MNKPTPEQDLIIAHTSTTTDNLLVNSGPGTGKTSTLVMCTRSMPKVDTLSLAFNKKIAEEMQTRLPGHVQAKTFNALGHQTLRTMLHGKNPYVLMNKMFQLLKEYSDALPSKADKEALSENFGQILRLLKFCKSMGYVPKTCPGRALTSASNLALAVASQIDIEITDEIMTVVDSLLSLSIERAFGGTIDFDDQIYIPTLFGGTFTKFPRVLVDETQDLSPLNYEMLEQVVSGPVLAIGDRFQSIYGFRGAHSSAMEYARDRFSMHELGLSISFRCPQSIIREARFRFPALRWRDGAEDGIVQTLDDWPVSHIPRGDVAIICRNNAPLYKCALQLIRAGRGVTIVGSDIGNQLIKLLVSVTGGERLSQAQCYTKIDEWETKEIEKASKPRYASIHNRADCLRVFVDFSPTARDAVDYAKLLFASSGPIQLMTGHKAKGLEFDTVYFLNSDLIPSKYALEAQNEGDDSQMEQELNLKYVIITRAKRALYYVSLETLRKD